MKNLLTNEDQISKSSYIKVNEKSFKNTIIGKHILSNIISSKMYFISEQALLNIQMNDGNVYLNIKMINASLVEDALKFHAGCKPYETEEGEWKLKYPRQLSDGKIDTILRLFKVPVIKSSSTLFNRLQSKFVGANKMNLVYLAIKNKKTEVFYVDDDNSKLLSSSYGMKNIAFLLEHFMNQ